jgi:hypothetical protein
LLVVGSKFLVQAREPGTANEPETPISLRGESQDVCWRLMCRRNHSAPMFYIAATLCVAALYFVPGIG